MIQPKINTKPTACKTRLRPKPQDQEQESKNKTKTMKFMGFMAKCNS